MIDLYYWPTGNGLKVGILLEELGQEYRLLPINIRTGEQKQDGFQAISANGRIPAIVDHAPTAGDPLSLFESGAILNYLANKAGRFCPPKALPSVSVCRSGCSGRSGISRLI
ncbi:GST-like protein [Pseudomonas abietaniphila]|jgi:GST-like protein|uniref:GST-like protein n=1 Tax=Pseudomonas abietaniphila TaxID=89065 RepID=A0A1G8ITR1_9PSED|nr:GST-like protein [Pseudomonas abietaniphila]